jgi:hypothetical protein
MTATLSTSNKANLAQRISLGLREKIAQQVSQYDRVSRALALEIDKKHTITKTYHVTLGQLQRFLKRLHQHSVAATKQTSISKKAGVTGATADAQLQARRERQAEIATVLQHVFGNLAELEPELWSHRAFLMLMGLAYEKLSTNQHELSTDELVKLTKALGDACRVQPQIKVKKAPSESGNSETGPLPNNFAEIVRHVYGTNFIETEKDKPATSANQSSDREGAGR